MRYFGELGLATTTVEDPEAPGVFIPVQQTLEVKGDVLRSARYVTNGQNTTNNSLTMQNRISIVLSEKLLNSINYVEYLTYMDVKWKVTNIEIVGHRAIMTLGGVWNERATGES